MVDYILTFVIPQAGTYGIEDYKKPGDHFFPHLPHKRYRVWKGGCGIGQRDTEAEAIELIRQHAREHLEKQRTALLDRLLECTNSLKEMRTGTKLYGLASFKRCE
jgi:hypothetical protein